MVDLLVRLKGVPEELLAQLVRQGYFANKSEAIRAGILQLGKEYQLLSASQARAASDKSKPNASNQAVVEVLDRWM